MKTDKTYLPSKKIFKGISCEIPALAEIKICTLAGSFALKSITGFTGYLNNISKEKQACCQRLFFYLRLHFLRCIFQRKNYLIS